LKWKNENGKMKKNSLHKTKSLLSLCASIVFIFHFSFFIFSCSGEYIGVPRVEVLSYQTAPTYGGLHSLATAYGLALNDAVKADTLHPGMYAEYGVTLALMGHKGPACRMLNAEMKAFPESRGIVTRIKQRLMPDMVADTLAALRDTANLAQLAEWAYDSLTALRPFPTVAPVIDSTDPEWISQQTPVDSIAYPVRLTANEKRELLERQQAEEAQRQKAIEDSIAAAKQAVIDAREQAKKDKERAREEARKQREQQKKEVAAQREAARKQQQAQREEERKRKAAEREAAKKNKTKK
jgi:hypothetical protein